MPAFKRKRDAQHNPDYVAPHLIRPSALLTQAENEQRVADIVRDAKADWQSNLLSIYWAYVHSHALYRHQARFKAAIGAVASAGSNWRMVGFLMTISVLFIAALLWDNHWPWYGDLLAGAAYAVLIFIGYGRYRAYYGTFIKVYCIERADFTDPSQVTGLVTIWLPRLVYFYRPEVWRGNNGENGLQSSKAYCVVQTGIDRVEWNTRYNPLTRMSERGLSNEELVGNWDLDEWCMVYDGRLIETLRNPPDYYDLPADNFMANCVSMKLRRAWCRALQRNGALVGKLDRGKISVLDGHWAWIYAGAMALLSFVLLMLAIEG